MIVARVEAELYQNMLLSSYILLHHKKYLIHYLQTLKCVLTCTWIVLQNKKHNALIQDETCDNIIEPTNDIENTDVNDTELMHQNNIINDDVIDNSTNITSDSRHDVLKHDLFETTSI